MKAITKVYDPEFPSFDLSDCDNSALANLINAFEERSDRDVKTVVKRGRAKMLASLQKLADEKGFDLGQGQYLYHIVVMGSFADWLEMASAPVVEETPVIEEVPVVGKVPVEKAPKAPSVREVAEGFLLTVVGTDEDGRDIGLSYDQALAEVLKVFPNAKTTIACLRWYAVHMRDREVKLPSRPRSGSTPKTEKAEEAKGE